MSKTEASMSSQQLFVNDDGSPMIFHLPPGATKRKLAIIVKKHGGEITSRRLKNIVCLADENLWASSKPVSEKSECYWPTYILDCVKKNQLLELDKYRCSRGTRLMRKISLEDGQDDSFNDDDMAPTKSFITVPIKKKGRMHYSKVEDMNIIKYLMENGEYRRVKGIAVWLTMEKLEITPHPAQSMMTRFRKVIVEQLDQYNIPDTWKSCLTGDLVYCVPSHKGADKDNLTTEDSTDDEYHPEPSTSKISTNKIAENEKDPHPLHDASHASESDNMDDFDKSLLKMVQTSAKREQSSTLQLGSTTVSSAAELRKKGIQTRRSLLSELNTMDHSVRKELPSPGNQEDHFPQRQEKSCSRNKKRMKSPGSRHRVLDSSSEESCECSIMSKNVLRSDSEQETHSKSYREKANIPEMVTERHFADSSVSQQGKRRSSLDHEEPVAKKNRPAKNTLERVKSHVLHSSRSKYKIGTHFASTHEQNKQQQQTSVNTRKSSPQKRSREDSSSDQVVSGKGKATFTAKQTRPSAAPGQNGRSQGKEERDTAKSKHNMDISSLKLLQHRAHYLTRNNAARRAIDSNVLTVKGRQKDDGSDAKVKTQKKHRTGVNDKVSSSNMNSSALTENGPESQGIDEAGQGEVTVSSGQFMQTFVCSIDSEDTGNETSQERRQRKTVTAMGVVRTLSEEFGLTLREAQVLLYRHSGHVDATRYWIMTGRSLPGHNYWPPSHDDMLLEQQPDQPDWQRLEQLYGLSTVLQRIQWLQNSV